MSGRAVEAAGDVDTLLLDKTGTITLGNRRATELIPAPGVSEIELADAASCLRSPMLNTRGPVDCGPSQGEVQLARPQKTFHLHAATFIPFTAVTRMSGVDLDGRQIRKGAFDAIAEHCGLRGNRVPPEVENAVKKISNSGGTPLLVAEDCKVLGAIHLKDII